MDALEQNTYQSGAPIIPSPVMHVRFEGVSQVGPLVLYDNTMPATRGSTWQEEFLDSVVVNRMTINVI